MDQLMGEKENLTAFLNLEHLQILQDNLAKALGLAFVTVDYRGRLVTSCSGFTRFCDAMRRNPQYGSLCSQCYAHGGLHATMAGKPYLYRCHCGLVEFAVPLMVDGTYMGAVMGGQCELDGKHPDLPPVLPQRTAWEQVPEIAGLRSGVHKTTFDKLKAGVDLLQDILQQILEEERGRQLREELIRKNQELLAEKTARINRELVLQEQDDSGELTTKLDSEHLFFMLNVISRLAFLEKAPETERTACDFAAMMRYVLENGDYNCVTLGEELEYIDYYLQVQKRRLEGRLRYEIRVPDKYCSSLCPFMLLHPLVKNIVKHVLDSSRDGGSLTIDAAEEGGLLVISIQGDCPNLTAQMLEQEVRHQGKTIHKIDQILKNAFGQRCGVVSGTREDQHGAEIRITLPLQGVSQEK